MFRNRNTTFACALLTLIAASGCQTASSSAADEDFAIGDEKEDWIGSDFVSRAKVAYENGSAFSETDDELKGQAAEDFEFYLNAGESSVSIQKAEIKGRTAYLILAEFDHLNGWEATLYDAKGKT